ncbi:MAG TPA: hypothetical protein VII56_11085 [Rhizomicrobium sp.]
MNGIARCLWAIAAILPALSPMAAAAPTAFTPVVSVAALQGLGINSAVLAHVSVASYLPGGTLGGGQFDWNANDSSTPDNVTVFAATGITKGRWEREIVNNTITPYDAGAHCDGVTNDTAVMQAWVAVTQAKKLAGMIPSGTCLWDLTPPTGLPRYNVTANNSHFSGGPGATLVDSSATGGSNLDYHYCFFCALNVSGLIIEGLHFQAGTLLSCVGCTNPVVSRVTADGLHASTYLHGYGLYCAKTTGLKISDSAFTNFLFHIYIGALAGQLTTTRCGATISNTTEANNVAFGSFIATFPVGVYDFYGSDVTVTGGGCSDIYSSVAGGNPGTGMGYCIYEGDGAPLSLSVTGYTMHFDGNGAGNAIGILVSAAQNVSLVGNPCWAASGANLLSCDYIAPINATMKNVVIANNTMLNLDASATGQQAIYITGGLAGVTPQVTTNGNSITGFESCIRADNNLAPITLTFSNDNCTGQIKDGIRLQGMATQPLLFPHLTNETVVGSGNHAVQFYLNVVSPSLVGNHFLDGNTANQSGDAGAAVYFGTGAYGSLFTGNVIANTPYGGGQFTWGVQNATAAAQRPFKDIVGNNSFAGLLGGNGAQFGRYFNSVPTNGIFDLSQSEHIQNTAIDQGAPPGWYVTGVFNPALTATASNASTTITVNSTAGLAAGYPVLFTRTSNPYNGDYENPAMQWADTIASVTDAKHFVLSNGIPSGNGPYLAGTAVVTVARFSAEAAITP